MSDVPDTGIPDNKCYCQSCGFDFYTMPIPKESIDKGHYGEGYDCDDCGREKHFSSRIGRSWNDYIQEWSCPSCGVRVDRWTGEIIVDGTG